MRFLVFIILFANTLIAQTIKVNDTDFSKGKLGNIQTIELNDIAKFHGHLCDGLAEGFLALTYGLKLLYPEGIIDRTNSRIVSKSSPCLTDAAIYITGGRMQYDTFYVDNTIDGLYILQKMDNKETLLIKRKPNIKPAIIDEMGKKALKQELDACELEKLKAYEDNYTQYLLKTEPEHMFEITVLKDWEWKPQYVVYIKTDIINKHKSTCDN